MGFSFTDGHCHAVMMTEHDVVARRFEFKAPRVDAIIALWTIETSARGRSDR
jgi:hypothetical protein